MRIRTAMGMSVLAATVAALTGCASNDERPVQRLAAANASVQQAERSGAPRFAGAELRQAQMKLEQAQEASERGDYVIADRLAHEAEVDAEYASAAADSGRLQQAVDALRDSIDALRQELRREDRG